MKAVDQPQIEWHEQTNPLTSTPLGQTPLPNTLFTNASYQCEV